MSGTSGPIDVNSVVSQLIALEQSKRLTPLQTTQKTQDAQISNYGNLTNLLKTFQDNVNKLKDSINTVSFKVNSSNNDNLTASLSASNNMYAGSHTIQVTQMARAQSVSTAAAFGTGAANVTGDLVITKGGNNLTVTVAAGDTLAQIRDRINASSSNPGVTASILATNAPDGSAEYRLVLTSNETGTANGFTLSGSAAPQLNISNTISTAKDAKFTFDGLDVVRSSNTVGDVLEGLSFTLLKEGQTTTLDIASDTTNRNTNISTAVKNLFNSYNQIMSTVDSYQATTGMRDSTLPVIKKQLQSAMDILFSPSAPYRSLFDIGVKLSASQNLVTSTGEKYTTSGQYTVDDSKLTTALGNNFLGVKSFFTDDTQGLIKKFTKIVDQLTGAGGTIATRTDNINDQKKVTSKDIEAEQARLDDLKNTMTIQYAQLNAVLSKADSTSQMLTQQFASLSAYR